jgi:hypothetical protein
MRSVRLIPTLGLVLLAGGCVPSGPASTDAGAGPTPAPAPRPTTSPLHATHAAASGGRTRPPSPPLAGPFEDDFERPVLGDAWFATGDVWRIQGGKLCGRGAHNHPVWLSRTLPTNARIEFDAVSDSPDGDLKAEFFGDGSSAASGTTYNDATSYITIFGGWHNHFHVLARINEHASDRPEIKIEPGSDDERARPVVAGQVYHFKVERADGKTIRWWVGDMLMFSFADPQPLSGPGHDHFGFNDWEVPVCFDNVKVVPL